MPETPIHKDDRLVASEHKVWPSWQCPIMQPIAKIASEEGLSQQYLRLGMGASDP
jgi:hypothetical protein